MSDKPSAADIAKRARELGIPDPPKRAVPPTYPGHVGFGKQRIPPPPARDAPVVSAPVHELTKPGGFTPAPGSVAPYRRSVSPPPAELAPTPESVREARRQAREKVAESERVTEKVEKSTLESLAEIPGLRRGVSALWRWVLPFVLAALATVGGWVYGYAKGLANAYERVTAVEERARLSSERLKRIETGVEELRDSQAAEFASLKAAMGTESRKREQLVTDVEKIKDSLPRVVGLKPSP